MVLGSRAGGAAGRTITAGPCVCEGKAGRTHRHECAWTHARATKPFAGRGQGCRGRPSQPPRACVTIAPGSAWLATIEEVFPPVALACASQCPQQPPLSLSTVLHAVGLCSPRVSLAQERSAFLLRCPTVFWARSHLPEGPSGLQLGLAAPPGQAGLLPEKWCLANVSHSCS